LELASLNTTDYLVFSTRFVSVTFARQCSSLGSTTVCVHTATFRRVLRNDSGGCSKQQDVIGNKNG